MFHFHNHRYAHSSLPKTAMKIRGSSKRLTEDQLSDPEYVAMPRYHVLESEVSQKLSSGNWEYKWLVAYRGITGVVANQRSVVATILPKVALGNSAAYVTSPMFDASHASSLVAMLDSFALDYLARHKIGGVNLNFFIVKQLPVIPPHIYTQPLLDLIMTRVLELTYTAWDMQPFARDLGYDGAPFVWDDERRFLMRCELDALYFHLYGIERDDVAYIMDTFPIVKRKDEAAHGEYRTKRVILEMYDQMASMPTMLVPAPKEEHGEITVPDVSHWVTPLDPPPADPRAAHDQQL